MPILRIVACDAEWDKDNRARLACVSFAEDTAQGRRVWLVHGRDPELPGMLARLFEDESILTVWAWGGADFTTFAAALGLDLAHKMCLAAQAGRVSDVAVREALYWIGAPQWGAWWGIAPPKRKGGSKKRTLSIADAFAGDGADSEDWTRPGLGLAAITFRWRGASLSGFSAETLDKDKAIQTGYGPLVDLPLEEWSPEARQYALDDAAATLDAWLCQAAGRPEPFTPRDARLEGAGAVLRYQRHMAHRRLARLRRYLGNAARLAGAPPHLLANERERVVMLLAQAWTEEHAELYVDGPYLERITCAYQGAADLARAVLREEGLITPQDTLGVTLKTEKAHKLYTELSKHQATWGPSLTDGGKDKARYLQQRPWREWREDDRRFASTGGKIVAEAAALLERDPRVAAVLTSPGDAVIEWMETGDYESLKYALASARDRWAVALAIYQRCNAYLSNFLQPLAEYAREGKPIKPRLALVLITGRISLAGAIRQNEPRKGGIRECFLPPPGQAIFLRDFSQIELVCLGWLHSRIVEIVRKLPPNSYTSELARVINAGKDAHIILGIDLLREQNPEALQAIVEWAGSDTAGSEWALHDACKHLRHLGETVKKSERDSEQYHGVPWSVLKALNDGRQEAKSCNYGLGGCMGPATFVATQRKTGNLTWTIPKAQVASKLWRGRWTDTGIYERFCGKIVNGPNMIAHPFTGRLRSGLTLTACANIWFQGLAADMFVYAYTKAWYESVFVPSSPLYGCTIVLPIHDEIVGTCPLEQVQIRVDRKGHKYAAAPAEDRLGEIMLEAAAVYLPGMLVETSGATLAELGEPATREGAKLRAASAVGDRAANTEPAANASEYAPIVQAQRWRKV